jgi:nucleoside-diphosphate-sugar epimerase
MPSHVFVTGASGRVASRLIPRLLEAGHTVTGLTRTESKAAAVRSMGATCVVGELGRPDVIDEGLAGAKIVFHLAGGMRGAGQQTPDRINRLGTLSLLDRLEHAGELDAVVFTSSCAVYGDRSGLWVDDDMPAHPHTRYGASKVAAENALVEAAARGLPVRIARLAAVYGPGFPFMLETWIREGKAWLPGEGRNVVPTIHVEDAVTALMLLASPAATHIHYNLADRSPVSVAEFYGAVANSTGGTPPKHWSTWIPSYVQFAAARWNERVQSRTQTRPRFTPDAIRLMTASVRMKTERLEQELGMEWSHPNPIDGLTDVFSSD